MKHLYWLFLLLLGIFPLPLKADITLHEASDVSRTKATLSANFTDLSVSHGFQYKYGVLPEIDDFSRTALASQSDPVHITTSGNEWSARTVRGWVESAGGLSAGQSSVMSATVVFHQASTITFDWSVDSEENIGVLSFSVDGEEIASISGMVDFTTVSHNLTAGEHTVEWKYAKSSETNVGLDIGMVRNIYFCNTTPGEWIDVPTHGNEVQLETLYPSRQYLFRAYSISSGYVFSDIKEFETLSLPESIGEITVNSVTQTKASVNVRVNDLGCPVQNTIAVSTYRDGQTSFTGLMHPYLMEYSDTELLDGSSRGSCYASPEGYVYTTFSSNITGYLLGFSINIAEPFRIKFVWGARGVSDALAASVSFCIDDVEVGGFTASSNTLACEPFEYVIEPGNHRLSWNVDGIKDFYVQIGSCVLERASSWEKVFPVDGLNGTIQLEELLPVCKYQAQDRVVPDYDSPLEQSWFGSNTDWIEFSTLNVSAENLDVSDISQASATIRGKIDGGDATLFAAGLQYKDVSGDRWTNYPKEVAETELSQTLTRLRPATTCHYRTYVQAEGCDTVFSEVKEFTTLAVEARKPVAVRVAQHSALLQGEVVFGDATIYQRGMQFRKTGTTDWEDVEDIGEGTVYTLKKSGLEMGTAYEARTYIQPAGGDIIYSDILKFVTLDVYIGSATSSGTQTTIDLTTALVPLDEDVVADEYGFEYYAHSDGFYMGGGATDLPSDIVRVPVEPEGEAIHLHLEGLTPFYGYYYRAYVKIGDVYYYTKGYAGTDKTWNGAGTQRAGIAVEVEELTQTKALLKLDATQDGDATVTQIEYGVMNLNDVVEEYLPCGESLSLEGLTPGTQYGLAFRGLVNGRWCPLLLSLDWDYSLYEFETKPANIEVGFKNITQTKADMLVSLIFGDADVHDLYYRLNGGEYQPYGDTKDISKTIVLEGLTPGMDYYVDFRGIIGENTHYYWNSYYSNAYQFTTMSVDVSADASSVLQTAATIEWEPFCGDATYVRSGIEYELPTGWTDVPANGEEYSVILTELLPSTSYSYRAYVETKEGGRVYSETQGFITHDILCETLPVSNISNRSATLNGIIECDSYSSAEFGFQWKQMEGWSSEPAFTKGYKNEDGSISVGLVNGMLEPNTDYQYRTAVRYQGEIYYADTWETFRTESEYIYYPANVYTIFRTDRENNCLILCGYYVAGSEEIVEQGYEYWSNSTLSSARDAGNVVTIHTDESMQYSLDVHTLQSGNYSVRAFVTTSSGIKVYGNTLSFGVQNGELVGISETSVTDISCAVNGSSLIVYNAAGLSCVIYNVSGMVVTRRDHLSDMEVFNLPPNLYIIRFNNGVTHKIII